MWASGGETCGVQFFISNEPEAAVVVQSHTAVDEALAGGTSGVHAAGTMFVYTRLLLLSGARTGSRHTHTYITIDDRKTKIEDMVANRHRGVVGMCFLRHRQHDEPLFRDQGTRCPVEHAVALVPSCEGRTPPQMSR